MTSNHRRHVIVPEKTLRILEAYQRQHQLPSFSATIEAAALALQQQELKAAYQTYAREFERDIEEQAQAQAWLDFPLQEEEARLSARDEQ